MFGRPHICTRSARRSSHRRGHLFRLFVIWLVVFGVLLTVALYVGAGSRFVSQMVMHWADQQGIQLQVDGSRMTGWGRVTLDRVHLPGASFGALGEIKVERVIVSFDLLGLLRGERGTGLISNVTLVSPDLTFSLPGATDDATVLRIEGADSLDWSETRPQIRPQIDAVDLASWAFGADPVAIEVRQGRYEVLGDNIQVQGTVDFEADLHADGLRLETFAATVDSPTFAGKIGGQAEVHWPAEDEMLRGTLQGHALQVTAAGDAYALDSFTVTYHLDEDSLIVDSFTGKRDGSTVTLRGTIHSSGTLDLAVEAKQLDLAKDIVLLERFGFSGPGHFEGHLSGVLARPVLHGDVEVGPGEVWGRPNVSGTGQLTVTQEALRFADVRLRQYGGDYDLAGIFTFGSEDSPGHLDLNVQSESGRVQELLAVLGWDLPVTGRLYGDMHFQGDLGAIKARGTVDIVEAVAWSQPLDRATGSFVWNDGLVQVEEVNLTLGMGHVSADGSIDLTLDDGHIDFTASDWPLGFTRLFEERLGHVLGGLISIRDGHVAGSLSSPHVAGTIEAEALRFGPTLFRSVTGRMAYRERALELDGLLGARAGGGEYTLSGLIEFPETGETVSDLAITVSNERLRSLLQLANEELPAALIDGQVAGDIRVTGTLSDPEAEMDLILKETFALQKGIRIAMRFADGALRINDLGLM